MNAKLTPELKEKILQEANTLVYWCDEGSPHHQPDEGFCCDDHSISISFPVKKKFLGYNR